MNEIMQVIKNRRSIRSFSADQIRREELDVIVEAGMYAPSAAGKGVAFYGGTKPANP